ncbi:hypothetical protein N8D74_05010 [Curtobacterium flaccumfaciens]|uniref:Uncharacterized protein n=1 Tax=Curtobacterium poinsettiae TaxID=159612 RepID=A0A9Q9P8J6_9MICO|nr:hypothetical protein [Curtobacterium flaccumfaciens]UXN26245.1 hypothetical protein N8D74_05010 [Curtobacterium flaccumfaciens]UYC81089.1 hypothetical protein OE229_01100 [Curtobacterium flaccumfaciens pv. poinsettiae]
MKIVAQGVDGVWLPVPSDLGDAPVKKIVKWAQPAAREVLPRRAFSPHPKQMFLQTLFGAVAQATRPNEQYFIHRAALPAEVLVVRVRWEPAEPDLTAQLQRLVGPGDSRDVEVGGASPVVIVPGIEGWRAGLHRSDEVVGHVAAFERGGLSVQVRVDLPPEWLVPLQPDVEQLVRSLETV